MNIKKILALFLAAVMLLSLAACTVEVPEETKQTTAESTTAPTESATGENADTTAAKKMSITVKVVHADGSEKVFPYETDEEFLGDVLLADKLIEGKEGPYGLEISHVDGEQAIYDTDKAYWALYEGDQYALQGISTTPVVDGGEYALVYTKG